MTKVILIYPYNFLKNYITNYIVAYIPFYFIRNFYYKYVQGISIAKGSSIHMGCYINRSNIKIGINTAINRKCYLDGRGEITIGNNVSISPEVQIITGTHDVNSKDFKFEKKRSN